MLKKLYSITKFICSHPITKNNKLKAVISFLRWQVAVRLLGKKVIVPWVEDSKFVVGLGETGLTGNIYVGLMEYEDMLFLLHALHPDETFVDVGANIGAYTILASKVVKANSICFEPLPETIQRLEDQIQVNRLNELVSIKNKGVGNKRGDLFFTNNNDTLNKVCIGGVGENITRVDVTTLDNELDKNKKYFFKIDVEGFEYNVIEGGKDILSSPNTSALIIELNGSGMEFGYSNEDIHSELINLNFIPVKYDPINRSLKKLIGHNKDGGNTIYVKNIGEMMKRCLDSPARCIHTANNIYI